MHSTKDREQRYTLDAYVAERMDFKNFSLVVKLARVTLMFLLASKFFT